jgi:long-chain acyl-CoA synthetase
MAYPALTKCFLEAIDRHRNPRAQMYRSTTGWQAISADQMLRNVAALSRVLAGLGVGAGDRVGIFAPNCPEWHTTDFAAMGLGAATVPVYFNESADRMAYILNDSGARVVVSAGEIQARRINEIRNRLASIEHVISARAPANLNGDFLKYEEYIASATDRDVLEYRRRAAAVAPDTVATIIYTSGTTGEPKGVVLNHSNLSSNALDSSASNDLSPSDVGMSFLPLAHVYERVVDYTFLFQGVPFAYVESIESVQQALLEVRPTIVAAVPRFYEKIYANILERGHRQTGLKRKIFDWALRVANDAAPWRAYKKNVPVSVRLKWQIADKLVYSKIRQGLGGKIRSCSSGGAPLAPDLAVFFWAIGLPVYEGYGLTETSPVVSANVPEACKVGTVGRPIKNVQVKIAEDGEILVKGPLLMQGYYHKAEDTKEAFTPDGWLRTGDIGNLDEDGFLTITDRKKELLKTAAGKFVAPAPIENLLKTSRFFTNAMVIGDKRKFISVLIVPNFSAIEAEASKQGKILPAGALRLADPWVRDLISGEIERLTASLAQYEKPKRFALVEKDFTFDGGELTYTLKLKRRVIEHLYQDIIVRLYADVEEPRPHHLA